MKRIAATARTASIAVPLALSLAACTPPEAVILEEPIVAEIPVEIAPAAKVENCVAGEDDGIGGTGCSVD